MNQQVPTETTFGSISPAEFFYRNRQLAGFGNPSQAVYSAVRELIENSLDSCEDAQRLPSIDVRMTSEDSDIIRICVSDNGTGIAEEYVPRAFATVLYGSKFHNRQRRGTFGLGVTMAVLYGQITTDSPVIVHTQYKGSQGKEYALFIDVETNQPIVKSSRPLDREYDGTSVTLQLRGDLKRAEERIIEYVRLSTVSTPHAQILLEVDGTESLKSGRWWNIHPPPVISSNPHPRAADLEMLRRLAQNNGEKRLQDFLVASFQKVGIKTSSRFLKFVSFDPARKVSSLTRDDFGRLSTALRKFDGFENPDSKSLSPIGKEAFLAGIKSTFNTVSVYYSSRGPSEWQGNPFIVEGVIAIGDAFPRSDIPILYRFANRVPLLYDSSEDVLTKTMKRLNWKRYNVDSSAPASLFIHICSTRVPYKAAGKQSIDTIPEVETEVLSLMRDLGRHFGKTTRKSEKALREGKKMREYARAFRHLAKFGADLAGTDEVPSTSRLVKQLFEVYPDE
ncbi:MAG: DNA topoisomerase VI subunit B [Candidatus Thorarchaeota archaeon]|nr:DNA topoisomerase VI subunit B [Candidatus Thorarchaeota archaeon]